MRGGKVMEILSWLNDNKTWIFSGLGIAVPLAILTWMFSRSSNKSKQIQKGGAGSVNIQAGGDIQFGDKINPKGDR